MNTKKKILTVVAAFFITGLVFSQTATLHGYMDYSVFPLGSSTYKDGDANWEQNEYAAEQGSFYDGRTEISLQVTAANFLFNLAFRLNAGLGTWYNLYVDTGADGTYDSDVYTYFDKGNVRVSFLNDQFRIYTGKFEEENFGYIPLAPIAGNVCGTENTAERGTVIRQHFTGVEFLPYAVSGLAFMVGAPITPVYGNGVSTSYANDYVYNVARQFKAMARYKISPLSTTLYAGYYNAMEFDADDYTGDDDVIREGWVSANTTDITFGNGMSIPLVVGYNFRYLTVNGGIRHGVNVGTTLKFGNLTIAIDNRDFYAIHNYSASSATIFCERFFTNFTYSLPNSMAVGFNANIGYMTDDSGQEGDGHVDAVSTEEGSADDNIWVDTDYMDTASSVTSGTEGQYIGIYGYPYIQKNFDNGYARLGVEIQYTQFTSGQTNIGVGYRIPVGLCFWF